MYVDNSGRKVTTYHRPQVEKKTVSLPNAHHVLEDILAKPSVRKALLWMTRRDSEGKCLFMRLCENYDNPQADFWTRLKWSLPHWAIDFGLWKSGLNPETMKQKLFHHPPTVKALTLTAKSIGTYGLTLPQRYTAPMFPVWNIFAIDLGCHTFSHFNFIPVGRGREIMTADLTPDQRERLLQKLQRHLEESKITVVSTAPQFGRACILYGAEEGLFATGHAGRGPGKKTMVLSRYIGGCGTGRCYCAIQPNGIITPCVYIAGLKVGDLRRQTLAQIWQHPLFATLSDREDRGDHCGVCDYRHYCGGCRARAFAYTGDIQAGDPGCVYNCHQWQELCEAEGTAECYAAKAPAAAGGAIATNGLVHLAGAIGAVRTAAPPAHVEEMQHE